MDSSYKDPKSNSLNVTYSIAPTAPLMTLTNNTGDLTSMVSYPDFRTTITSAMLNASTGTLTVFFTYE